MKLQLFHSVNGMQMSLHVAKSDQQQQRVAARQKLIILLVGLPARGKTYLANKIMCYMNWCLPSPLPVSASRLHAECQERNLEFRF